WVSERPSRLRVDAAARLHCPDGPALQYPDGWSHYAWKDVEVPAWMIEHPETVTPAAVADVLDPAMRNLMVEIMTPERVVKMGGARGCEGRDRRAVAQALGLPRRHHWVLDGRGGRERHPGGGRLPAALHPAGALAHAYATRGRGMDVRDRTGALRRTRCPYVTE